MAGKGIVGRARIHCYDEAVSLGGAVLPNLKRWKD